MEEKTYIVNVKFLTVVENSSGCTVMVKAKDHKDATEKAINVVAEEGFWKKDITDDVKKRMMYIGDWYEFE